METQDNDSLDSGRNNIFMAYMHNDIIDGY